MPTCTMPPLRVRHTQTSQSISGASIVRISSVRARPPVNGSIPNVTEWPSLIRGDPRHHRVANLIKNYVKRWNHYRFGAMANRRQPKDPMPLRPIPRKSPTSRIRTTNQQQAQRGVAFVPACNLSSVHGPCHSPKFPYERKLIDGANPREQRLVHLHVAPAHDMIRRAAMYGFLRP
jgi:hypothetical protein